MKSKTEHKKRAAPEPAVAEVTKAPRVQEKPQMKCFICKEFGHMAKECPRKKPTSPRRKHKSW